MLVSFLIEGRVNKCMLRCSSYPCATPPDLGAPVSPSAILVADVESARDAGREDLVADRRFRARSWRIMLLSVCNCQGVEYGDCW